MALLIDTHSHLYLPKLQPDIDDVLARAREVCSHIILPNIDPESIPAIMALSSYAPGFCLPTMGLHPCDASENWEAVLADMLPWLENSAAGTGPRMWAVGETGLDLYWDKTTLERQKAALRVQVEWAKRFNLPIILHARDAVSETLDLIEAHYSPDLRGIFHCFDGDATQARRVCELGTFMIGVGGPVTYKTSTLPEVLATVPLQKVVVETDSPFLPPVPYRGKRNESAYVRFVAERLCDVYGLSYNEIAEQTSANAKTMFAIEG